MGADPVELQSEQPIIRRIVACYAKIVSECAAKLHLKKPAELKFFEDAEKRVIEAIKTNSTKKSSADRLLSLLTYITEISWSFLYRALEICGAEYVVIQNLRDELIHLHREHFLLPCTKGLEMTAKCLIFTHRISQPNAARGYATSWESYIGDISLTRCQGGKSLSLSELQRIVIFYSECCARATDISILREDLHKTLIRVSSLIHLERTTGEAWFVIQSVVDGEIRMLSSYCSSTSSIATELLTRATAHNRSDGIESEVYSSSHPLIAVIESIDLKEQDPISLELLSRSIILTVQLDIIFPIDENSSTIQRKKSSKISARCTFTSISGLLMNSILAKSRLVCDPAWRMEGRILTFITRMYNLCLNWLQKHFQSLKCQDKMTQKSVDTICNPSTVIAAGDLIRSVLHSLTIPSVWSAGTSSIVGVLRAIGNCLSQLPVEFYDGSAGAVLSYSVSTCISSLLDGCLCICTDSECIGSSVRYDVSPDQHSDIVNVCVTLASLVGAKCLGRKLLVSCAHLSASTLHAVHTTVRARGSSGAMLNADKGHLEHGLHMRAASPVTVDASSLNRVLTNLAVCFSLGRCDADTSDFTFDATHGVCTELATIGCKFSSRIEASSPVMRTVYAGEFLYTVCADVLLRMSCAPNSPGTVSEATLYISELLQSAVVNKALTEEEATVSILHFQSFCLWGEALSADPWVSNNMKAEVVEALWVFARETAEPAVSTVPMGRGKGRAKKTPKGDLSLSSLPPLRLPLSSPIDSLRTHACRLRVYMLLALWGLSTSASKGDDNASGSTRESSMYLTRAVQALGSFRECVGLLSPDDLKAIPVTARYTLSADAASLYHMLGLSGRTEEQVTVSTHLLSCEGAFLSDCQHPKSQTLLREYRHTAEELAVMNDINAVWCGDECHLKCTADIRSRTAGSEECGVGSARSESAGGSSGSPDVPYYSSRLMDPASRGQGSDLQCFIRQSRALLTYRSVEASADEICGATHAAASTRGKRSPVIARNVSNPEATLKDCEEYESLTNALLSQASSLTPSSSAASSSSSPKANMVLTSSLKAWVSLLASKSIFMRFGDHQRAFRWVRRALSYVSPRGGNQQRQRGMGGEGASCLALDKCLPRLEAILLCAELYEQTGSTDSCLSYMVEAAAIGKATSVALRNIAALHSIRIWHRLGSARLMPALRDLEDLGSAGEESEVVEDDVSKRARAACRALSEVLAIDDSTNVLDPCKEISQLDDREIGGFGSALQYRQLDELWGFSSQNIGSFGKASYRTTICAEDRALLALAAGEARSYHVRADMQEQRHGDGLLKHKECPSDAPQVSSTLGYSAESATSELLCRLRESKAFDLVRDVRRMACLQAVQLSRTHTDTDRVRDSGSKERATSGATAFRTFLLGASSCGTAMQCALEKQGSVDLSPGSVQSVSKMIAAACCSKEKEKDGEREGELSELHHVLHCSLRLNGEGGDAVCFAAIESVTGDLLVGRSDATGTSVCALQVGEELTLLLNRWSSCMAQSKALLHLTLDAAAVAKWTDTDKRAWWAKRTASDSLIEDLLSQLEVLLGSAVHLLRGTHTDSDRCGSGRDIYIVPYAQGIQDRKKAQRMGSPREKSLDVDMELLSKQLNSLKVTELRQLLKSSRLSAVGKKSDMVTRLMEHSGDAACPRPSSPSAYEDPQSVTVRSVANTSVLPSRLSSSLSSISSSSYSSNPTCIGQSSGCTTSAGASHADRSCVGEGSRPHTVLILDEVLQQIPWEVLPCLRAKKSSRVPSLALLVHMILRDSETTGIDAAAGHIKNSDDVNCKEKDNCAAGTSHLSSPMSRTWYALDPEGNLPATRSTISAFLQPYIDRYGWEGFVGDIPSEEQAKKLHNSSNLFVYCGHGAGEKICDSQKMRKWRCPSAMLWGCSSGSLSVQGVHDPHGVAIAYLLGGAQYVVANMWDVTDKDIDKLSMECMRLCFGNDEDVPLSAAASTDTAPSAFSTQSTVSAALLPAEALAASREMCKLKNAVGCAPVIYGLPRRTHNQ